MALEAYSDILENQLCIKDDGIPISDKYVTDTTHVLALINGRTERAVTHETGRTYADRRVCWPLVPRLR